RNPAILQYDGRQATAVGILRELDFGRWSFIRKALFGRLLRWLRSHPAFRHQRGVQEFAYDWRESISNAARWLGSKLSLEFGDVNRPSDKVRFSLITHSMGGLVARVAVTDGYVHPQNVRTIIHIGTPLRGSASAFRCLHRDPLPFLDWFVEFCNERKNGRLALE